MKVLQINAVCDTGSTGRICRELNDALMQRGHMGMVLYGNGESSYVFSRKVTSSIGVKFHAFFSRLLGKNAAYSPLATYKIIHTIRSYRPDVVHLHNLHGNFVSLKPLLKYLAKEDIPTVITLHDCWFFTGKCTHYTQCGCYKWQTGCYQCPKLDTDIPSWFFDRTGEMWAEKKALFRAIPRLAVISVSDWITNEAKKSFLKDAAIVRRIYNWIDLEVFYPRGNGARLQYGIPEDEFTVLCIGAGWNENTAKAKDLLTLAQILGGSCRILLAGATSFSQKLPDNIQSIGYISSTEELAQVYSACDVYVHLSREDTFGKVIAEAIACGTPAIVYNATACPEIVGENCGFVVETGDLEEVVNAIETVKKLGKPFFSANCVSNARDRFAEDKLIAETINLYQQIQN